MLFVFLDWIASVILVSCSKEEEEEKEEEDMEEKEDKEEKEN